MGTLEGKLNANDIEILIESVDSWETSGNRDFHIMNMVKNAMMPDRDDDSYEFIKQVKDHFISREREIKADRSLRQEKATLLKAKLMLMRDDIGIDQLFEESSEPVAKMPMPKKVFKKPVKDDEPKIVKSENAETPDSSEKLALAESFLDQVRITSYYQAWLDLHGSKSTLAKIEEYIHDCGMDEVYKEFLAS